MSIDKNLHHDGEIIFMKELLHDLINPLTTLTLLLGNQNIQNQEVKKSKNRIEAITKILSVLLKRSSKSEYNEIENENEKIWLRRNLSAITKCLEAKARLHNVSFVILCDSKIKLNIHPLPFYKMFLNIISNAIDSYEKCKGKNKIIIHAYQRNGKNIIDVEDFGCGFGKTDPNCFAQLKTTKENGHGLGISIIKKCANDCRSKVIFISKKNGGTIVRVIF